MANHIGSVRVILAVPVTQRHASGRPVAARDQGTADGSARVRPDPERVLTGQTVRGE